ncbi:hypothetical protein AB7C87_13615 [Natrarchaeobius sp. A-rgal3]|uniref:hypothetical protein n=1 Tax=Natrarchaeobius versutus TaxID=1679078 RepID=UPI00350F102E
MTERLTVSDYSPKTYRRASNASYLAGIAALLAGFVVGRPLVGLGAYTAGFVVGAAIPYLASRPVYDERDEQLTARASELVLTGLAYGGLVVFVGLFAAELAGYYNWSTELWAVFWAFCAFWLVWGGTYTYVRIRATP